MPRWRDRFPQGKAVRYIKVRLLGVHGTLKIVIPVENYPQKRSFRLADYHPLSGYGVLISENNI